MGWSIDNPTRLDSNNTEGLALAQGCENALDEILFAAFQYPALAEESQTRPIIVKLFSDNMNYIGPLFDRFFPIRQRLHHRVKKVILQDIIDRANRLVNNEARVRIQLEIHWISAHTDEVEGHDEVDEAAKTARSTKAAFATYNDAFMVPLPSVYEDLQSTIDQL